MLEKIPTGICIPIFISIYLKFLPIIPVVGCLSLALPLSKGSTLHGNCSLFSALYVNPKTQSWSQGRAHRSYMQTLCMPCYEINKMIYECHIIYRNIRRFCQMQPQTIIFLYWIRNVITWGLCLRQTGTVDLTLGPQTFYHKMHPRIRLERKCW